MLFNQYSEPSLNYSDTLLRCAVKEEHIDRLSAFDNSAFQKDRCYDEDGKTKVNLLSDESEDRTS